MAKKESCLLILVKMVLMITILLGTIIVLIFYMRERLNEYFNRGENIIVPDFRGHHLVQVFKDKPAELIIEKADEKFDFKIPKDHVIAQNPSPGTKVKPNKKVLLTISLGSKQVTAPDLKEKNIRESSLLLQNAQLKEGNRAYIASSKIPRDRIISQSPLPSSNQEIYGGIDMLISLGQTSSAKAPLPNFTGKNVVEIKANLGTLGLKEGKIIFKRDPNRAKDLIISTKPSPFEFVGEGAVVDFLVSSGNDKGTATADDLKRFEVVDQFVAPAPVSSGSAAVAPPKILLPDDPATEEPDEEDEEETTPPPEAGLNAGSQAGDGKTVPVSFIMPDGFLPKEVKFILLSNAGRQEVYSGVHKPNDHIKVNVPKSPGAKVQIYINNVHVEERAVQ